MSSLASSSRTLALVCTPRQPLSGIKEQMVSSQCSLSTLLFHASSLSSACRSECQRPIPSPLSTLSGLPLRRYFKSVTEFITPWLSLQRQFASFKFIQTNQLSIISLKTFTKIKKKCRTNEEDCEDCRFTSADDVVTFHFTICRKPWSCLSYASKNPNFELCRQMSRKWYKLRSELEKSWGRSGKGTGRLNADHYNGFCGMKGYQQIQQPYGNPIWINQTRRRKSILLDNFVWERCDSAIDYWANIGDLGVFKRLSYYQ